MWMHACLPSCLLLHSFSSLHSMPKLVKLYMMRLKHSYRAIGIFVYVHAYVCLYVYVRVIEWVCMRPCVNLAREFYIFLNLFSFILFVLLSFFVRYMPSMFNWISVILFSFCSFSTLAAWILFFSFFLHSFVYVYVYFGAHIQFFIWVFGCCCCKTGMFCMELKQENRLSSIYTPKKNVQILQMKTDNVQNGTFQVSSEGDSGSKKITKHRTKYIDWSLIKHCACCVSKNCNVTLRHYQLIYITSFRLLPFW